MIIDGVFVTKDSLRRTQVQINPQQVDAIASSIGTPDIVFPDHVLLFPAFIDIHVHAREDASQTQSYKENFLSASKAAINGGVAAIMDMPNNPIPPIDHDSYETKWSLAQHALIPILPYAGIGPGTRPFSFQGRKVPYKCFLGPSIGPLFFSSTTELEDTLRHYAGEHVSFHAEDPEILKTGRRPPEAEIRAIQTIITLRDRYHFEATVCHVSTQDGFRLCRDHALAIEVAPHHLFFADTRDPLLQVNPPIRSSQDRDYLLVHLSEADYLATDHAPHTYDEKQKGISGLTHLDTYGLFAAHLIVNHGISPMTISRLAANNPGRFFSHYHGGRWGELAIGAEAIFTAMDCSTTTTIEPNTLQTKAQHSPFLHHTFPASISLIHHPERRRSTQ